MDFCKRLQCLAEFPSPGRNFSPVSGFAPMTATAIQRLNKLNKVKREQEFKRRRDAMMNRPMLKRVFPQALAWTALAVLSGAMALAQDAAPAPTPAPAPVPAAAETPTPAATKPETPAPVAATRADGEIEQDVVHGLDASKALKSDLITAATIQGEVMLSGTVSSDASSELAEAIAAHVAGVTKVNNNLQVGNPQAPAKPDAQPMADNQPGDAGAPAMNDGPMRKAPWATASTASSFAVRAVPKRFSRSASTIDFRMSIDCSSRSLTKI